jgi:hypothetical protein
VGGPGLVTRPSSCDSLTDPELWSLIMRSRLIVYWEGSTLYHALTSELPAVPLPRLDVVAPSSLLRGSVPSITRRSGTAYIRSRGQLRTQLPDLSRTVTSRHRDAPTRSMLSVTVKRRVGRQGMNNPYDLHSCSERYREAALYGAQERHPKGCSRAGGRARSGWDRVSSSGDGALAYLLRRARLIWVAGSRREGGQ